MNSADAVVYPLVSAGDRYDVRKPSLNTAISICVIAVLCKLAKSNSHHKTNLDNAHNKGESEGDVDLVTVSGVSVKHGCQGRTHKNRSQRERAYTKRVKKRMSQHQDTNSCSTHTHGHVRGLAEDHIKNSRNERGV